MSESLNDQPPHAAESTRLVDAKAIVVIIAAATWLVFAASHYTVFDDEAFSCRLYAMPLGDMLHAQWSGADPDPPVFYVLQNLWVRAVGVGPLALRGLSILCTLAALIAIRAAARAWFGDLAGFIAMLIAALHPAHLFFGFAARWYALFLFLSACLLWRSGRIYRNGTITYRDAVAWGILAALAALTNYFGLVVAGFLGVALLWRLLRQCDQRKRLVVAFGIAILLFAAWIKPFALHLATFRDSSPGGSIAATLARTLVALTTGNLASITAWWVWIPMAIAGAIGLITLIRRWQALSPVALVLVGSILVAAFSRTMLDKYILTLSGMACVLLGGLFSNDRPATRPPVGRIRLGTLAPIFLAIAWLACGINLVTERHWSSLRWLDPIDSAIGDAVASGANAVQPVVATHPSARYYGAMRTIRADAATPDSTAIVNAAEWLDAYCAQDTSDQSDSLMVTANAMSERIRQGGAVPGLFTLRTSGYELLPDWNALQQALDRDYTMTSERHYLEDPDAALKDRIDPTIHHAPWRITLESWMRLP